MYMKFFFFFFLFASTLLLAQDGLIKKYYANGIIESEVNYNKNVRDGSAKFYYPTGVLKEELNYVNGRVEGDVKRYYESGRLRESFFIEEGRRSGAFISAADDSLTSKTVTFTNGILFIPQKEEPIAPARKTTIPLARRINKNMTFEEKVVASLNEPALPATDTLPVDKQTGYYTMVPEMPTPIIGMDSLRKKVVYPEEAKQKGIKGTVVLYAYVNDYGDVTKTEIVKGLGNGLDDAAEIAVYYTRFKPGRYMGKPQKVRTMISIEFRTP